MDELNYVINHIKPGNSPGSDGLTSEFYKFFWNDIKILVFESLSNGNDYGKMSEEQRRVVLRLISKKKAKMLQNKRTGGLSPC